MATTVKSLLVKIEADNKKMTTQLAGMNKHLDTSTKKVKAASNQFAGMWKQILGGAAAFAMLRTGFRSLTRFVSESVDLFKKQDQVERQLNAVLISTGHAAGLAAGELKEMAKALQSQTAFGDEAIINAENLLLTFKKVGRDVFPDALKAILDVSTAMGVGLKESAIQVGKALNDPIYGLTALRRVGITFDESQEKLIKSLTKTGQLAKAQALVLEELNSQFGGSAEAAAKGSGAIDQFNNVIGDFKEEIGKAIIDNSDFKESLESIKRIFGDPGFAQSIGVVVGEFAKFAGKAIEATAALLDFLVGIERARFLKTTVDDAENLANRFDLVYQSLIKSGMSANTLSAALGKLNAENQRLMEVEERILEIRKKTSSELWHAVSSPAQKRMVEKELIKLKHEMNQLLLDEINLIIKNNKEYGISNEIIEKARNYRLGLSKATEKLSGKTEDLNENLVPLSEQWEKQGLVMKDVIEGYMATYQAIDPLIEKYNEFWAAIKATSDPLYENIDISKDWIDTSEAMFPAEQLTSMDIFKEQLGKVGNEMIKVAMYASDVVDIIDKLGIVSDETTEALMDIVTGTLDLGQGLARIASGDIVGGAMQAISGAIDLIGGLFVLFEGKDPVEEAMEDWNELIEAGKEGAREMMELVHQMRIEGIELDEVTSYINEKLTAGIDALGDYYNYAATSQKRFNHAQLYTIALFGGLISQGATFVEAIMAMEDEFKKLAEIVATQGYEIAESLQDILDLTAFIDLNKDLVNAISATSEIMDAMFASSIYSIGQLQALMISFGQDVVDQFNQILASGGTNEQAWALVIPTLEKILYYAQEYGLAIDDQTLALIEQGESLGYMIDANIPPMEQLVVLFGEFIEMFADWIGLSWANPFSNWVLPEQPGGEVDDGTGGIDIDKIDKYATGGDFYINKPTPILVGEVPERVRITPLSKGGMGDGANFDLTIINDSNDTPMDLAEKFKIAYQNNYGGIKRVIDNG